MFKRFNCPQLADDVSFALRQVHFQSLAGLKGRIAVQRFAYGALRRLAEVIQALGCFNAYHELFAVEVAY